MIIVRQFDSQLTNFLVSSRICAQKFPELMMFSEMKGGICTIVANTMWKRKEINKIKNIPTFPCFKKHLLLRFRELPHWSTTQSSHRGRRPIIWRVRRAHREKETKKQHKGCKNSGVSIGFLFWWNLMECIVDTRQVISFSKFDAFGLGAAAGKLDASWILRREQRINKWNIMKLRNRRLCLMISLPYVRDKTFDS